MTEEQPTKRQKTATDVHENGSLPGSQEPDQAAAVLEAAEELDKEVQQLAADEANELRAIQRRYRAKRLSVCQRRNKLLSDIEGFWPAVFALSSVRSFITEEDTQVLQYLTSVEFQDEDDASESFEIKMHFKPNPFFKNDVLWRKAAIKGPRMEITSSSFEWQEGADLEATLDDEGQPMLGHFHFLSWFAQNAVFEEEVIDEVAVALRDELWEKAYQLYTDNEIVPLAEEQEVYIEQEVDEGEDGEQGAELEDGAEGEEGVELEEGADMAALEESAGGGADGGADDDDDDEDDADDGEGGYDDEDGAAEEEDDEEDAL